MSMRVCAAKIMMCLRVRTERKQETMAAEEAHACRLRGQFTLKEKDVEKRFNKTHNGSR